MHPNPDIAAHPARILIVDDEYNDRQLLENALAGEGFSLRTAAGGEEALALVAQQPPDLILLDAMMPRMDGYVRAGDGVSAIRGALEHQPDLKILDLGLPAADGFDVLEWFRVPR